jgi:hypothetical protein
MVSTAEICPNQAELSRDFKEIVRERIPQFESDMPSQAVRSLQAIFPRVIVLTADVPKVARVAGLGIVTLAKHSGCPIIPVAMATSRHYRPVLAGFAANPATHHSESATGHSGAGQSSRRGGPRRLMVSAGRGRSSPGVTPRRVYPALPERLRYVGPYQAGRDRHSTADRRAGEFGH